jgi:hypothetical protein
MSTQPPRHGDTAAGCPCEECLTARIRLSAAIAADGRDMSLLRQRLDGFKTRLAGAEFLRSVS